VHTPCILPTLREMGLDVVWKHVGEKQMYVDMDECEQGDTGTNVAKRNEQNENEARRESTKTIRSLEPFRKPHPTTRF